MRQILAGREPEIVRGFRHRGHHHVSRIESFSDAVFGFSLTLLVVSLAVPRSFTDLVEAMSGFPAFAVSFALLANIWYHQYRFFRRYALQDVATIVLNLALLFTVVFFTYPLKFLFVNLIRFSETASPIRADQIWQLFAIYGAGYAAVFGIFSLLHRHALSQRAVLELTPLEIFDTQVSMRQGLVHVGVAIASATAATALSYRGAYAMAGFAGGVIYPVGLTLALTVVGRHARRRRPLIEASHAN